MRRLLLPAVALLALSACGGGDDGDHHEVLAATYPAAFLAERVLGEEVGLLTPPGADPHDTELDPRQRAQMEDATLLVTIGGLQPSVDAAAEALDEQAVLDLSDAVTLIEADDDHDHGEHEDDGHDHDGHDHDGHEDDGHDHAHSAPVGSRLASHDDHDHDHGPHDPHFWLDPSRMIEAAEAIAERLGELMPDAAEEIDANAAELVEELRALDGEFEAGLAQCEHRTFVTSHAAFAYLADRYDLQQVAVAGLEPDSEPSPAQITRVVREIERTGVSTVFTEPGADRSIAETIAAEAGVEIAVLDPIESPEPDSDEDYLGLMHANLQALRAAGDCT